VHRSNCAREEDCTAKMSYSSGQSSVITSSFKLDDVLPVLEA
jgi:hypothetical protein